MSDKGNASEEIDLGQLFKLIGDAFNKLFQLIGNIFKGIFHFSILFLQFIRKHFLKFVVAGCVGLIAGWYLDYKAIPMYSTSMVIEPNFNSTQQLYNNIEYYDGLARRGESETLSRALEISDTAASTIKRIIIEPFSDEAQKLREYNDFIKQLDTASRKGIDYKFYLQNRSITTTKFHVIIIKATDPEVPKSCRIGIVESIVGNEYFENLKKVNDLNISLKDSIINNQLREIDSLQAFYQKLKTLEANKPLGTTSINLADNNTNESASEIELLQRKQELKEDQLVLNSRRVEEQNIINIISKFNDKATLDNNFFTKKKMLLPLVLVGLTFLALIFLSINRYLKNYEIKD